MLKQHIWSFLQDIQSELFHCKTHFAWYKISVCFTFFVICIIADSLERMTQIKNFNKVSQFSKLNFRFEVWIYLVAHVTQKMHDVFKINEIVWIRKFPWLDEKILHVNFILTHLMIAAPIYKSASYHARLIALFQ